MGPGHAGIQGHKSADELARAGALEKQIGPNPFCGIPKILARLILRNHYNQEALKFWYNLPSQHHSKELIGAFNQRRAEEALMLNRNQLRILARALTEHCCLNKHMSNIGVQATGGCRFCESADETPKHLLCECDNTTGFWARTC